MTPEDETVRDDLQVKRLRRALSLVAVGLLVVAASGAVGFLRGALPGAGEAASCLGAFSVEDAVQVAESKASAFEADAPAWFETELFSTDAVLECFSGADGGVWGFVVEGNAPDCFADVCSQMEGRGWVQAESGVEACATFVREEGEVRWALVSCSSADDLTTIVVQLA